MENSDSQKKRRFLLNKKQEKEKINTFLILLLSYLFLLLSDLNAINELIENMRTLLHTHSTQAQKCRKFQKDFFSILLQKSNK